MSKEKEKPKRLIAAEPWLFPVLRKREKVFLADLRNSALDFLTDVCRQLRDRESWVEGTASVTQNTIISMVVQSIISLIRGK